MALTVRLLAVAIAALILYANWPHIRTPDRETVRFLDEHGFDVITLPAGVTADEVWKLVALIEGLPEVARV